MATDAQDWFAAMDVIPPEEPGMQARVRGTAGGVWYDRTPVGHVKERGGRWTPDEPGEPEARWYDTALEASRAAAREYVVLNTRQLVRNLGGHAAWRVAWRAGEGLGPEPEDVPAWHTDAVVGRLTGEWGRGYPDAAPALCDRLEELGFDELAAILRESP